MKFTEKSYLSHRTTTQKKDEPMDRLLRTEVSIIIKNKISDTK